MSLDQCSYELHIMGKWVILITPLIILTFALLGEILTIMQVGHFKNLPGFNSESGDGTSISSGFIDNDHC